MLFVGVAESSGSLRHAAVNSESFLQLVVELRGIPTSQPMAASALRSERTLPAP